MNSRMIIRTTYTYHNNIMFSWIGQIIDNRLLDLIISTVSCRDIRTILRAVLFITYNNTIVFFRIKYWSVKYGRAHICLINLLLYCRVVVHGTSKYSTEIGKRKMNTHNVHVHCIFYQTSRCTHIFCVMAMGRNAPTRYRGPSRL